MSKFIRIPHRTYKSGKRKRTGGKSQLLIQRMPRPQTRTEPRALLRPFGLVSIRRPTTIKPRYAPAPAGPWRDRSRNENRLPILGLRSQRLKNFTGFGSLLPTLKIDLGNAFDHITGIPAKRRFCKIRKLRRTILFKIQIAGKGSKKSPGSGGTYRRTEESNQSC